MKKLLFILFALALVLNAKEVSQKDLQLHIGNNIQFGNIDAKMVYFGGYNTPECKLAISKNGQYFYLKKTNSTCKKMTNRKGVKIICNSNKSVCKTRKELVEFLQNDSSEQAKQKDNSLASWCNSSNLNKAEHTICASNELSKLDKKLAKVYRSSNANDKGKTQKNWLKERNSCKNDIICIKHSYKNRIAQLNKQQENGSLKISSKEIKTIKKLCKSNEANSCFALGIIYNNGKYGIEANNWQASKYYRKACDLGNAKGCTFLGIMYANGEGVNEDLNSALNYLKKGCSKGNKEACNGANSVRNMLKNQFRGAKKVSCYKINEYAPQRVCLEGTGGDACYGIKDYGLQRVCKEGAGTDACYGLKDYAMQRVCREGIRSDACYAIKNYNIRRSCQNFSGSTTFWLILAHYGYYTN